MQANLIEDSPMETPTEIHPHETSPAPSMTVSTVAPAASQPTELEKSAKAPTPTVPGYGHGV